MGTGRLTEWGRKAKQLLKGREARTVFFEQSNLPKEGERDSKLLQLIGQTVSLLYPTPTGLGILGTTPEHIFGLVYDTCLALGRDQDGTPWEDKAWSMIVRLWKEEAIKTEPPASISAKLEAGIKKWNPNLNGNIRDWASTHAILSWNKSCFVMTQDGIYDDTPINFNQLIARIREVGMEPFIPTSVLKANGQGFRDITYQEILNRHSSVVKEVEGVVSQKGGILRGDTFSLGLFHRREDLAPEWSDQVDEWIQKLCPTKEVYNKLCTWIGHSLAFEDGPICALSISGPPGCGKKMLAWGLAECINTETIADARNMGKYADELMKTGYMLINEGFPKLTDTMDPADTFRAFTGGDPIYVERKFMSRVRIHNPVRIIITANNLNVLRTLASHRSLSPDDRDALAQRLFHIDVPEDAGIWLRKMGGLRWTGTPGRRWIRGDDGSPSDCIIAKHFLKLHEIRPSVPASNRLLVEGDRQAEIIRMLSTQSGAAPDVIEIIIKMIEAKNAPGLHVVGRDIYVTAASILQWHRIHTQSSSGFRLSMHSIMDVLRGLLCPGWDADTTQMLDLSEKRKSFRARWWKLQADVLYREAMDCGYQCTTLEDIVNPIDDPKQIPERI